MTEIGFYHLQTSALQRALPKLLEKVVERGHRVLLLAGSIDRAEDLNGLLWTYEERSWLPHGGLNDSAPERQPILLTTEERNLNEADVLVVVDGLEPAFMASFARAIDMFDGRDIGAVEAARGRWRNYRERGYGLTYWQQTERGGWQQKSAT